MTILGNINEFIRKSDKENAPFRLLSLTCRSHGVGVEPVAVVKPSGTNMPTDLCKLDKRVPLPTMCKR